MKYSGYVSGKYGSLKNLNWYKSNEIYASWAFVVFSALFLIVSCLSGDVSASSDTTTTPSYAVRAADAPHNITHFLHSVQMGGSAKYFTPSFSVMNFMDTTLEFNETPTFVTGYEQFALQWYMYPALASNLTVTRMDAIMWISGIVATGTPNFAGSVAIYEVTEENMTDLNFNGYLVYYNNIPSNTPLYASPTTPLAFNITGTHTFKAGSTIRLVITINPGTSGGGGNLQKTNVTVWWDGENNFDSRLIMHTLNPMTIEDVWTEDEMGEVESSFLSEGNTTILFKARISDPFGGYDIKWVNLTIYDVNGIPIYDDVPMYKYEGNSYSSECRYSYEFNYSGLECGIYGYKVWAVDNSGYTYYYYFAKFTYELYDEEMYGNFSIGIMYNITIHVNDSIGNSLIGAIVDFEGVVGVTNSTGYVDMMVFGNGTLRVFWHGCEVYENYTTLDLSGNATNSTNNTNNTVLYIDCLVFHPELIFVDALGNALQGASVFFSYPDGYELEVMQTNILGSVGVIGYAPIGNSSVSVWWRGACVYDGYVNVQSNEEIVIKCDVFYLNVTVVDPWLEPLQFANVIVVDNETEILMESRAVNSEGKVSLRLPKGIYDSVVIWHGCEIASLENIALNTNTEYMIVGNVIVVNFKVVDTKEMPLVGAHVVVSTSTEVCISTLTDEDGEISAVLPGGEFRIEVFWLGFQVYNSQISLYENSNITLECSVVYVTFRTVDSHSEPVQTYLTLESENSGSVCSAGSTNALGNITLRLAVGEYKVSVHLLDVLVNSSIIQITGEDVLVNCAVYYIDVFATDAKEIGIENASFIFEMVDGIFNANTLSNSDGVSTVRLPKGVYNVSVYYKGVNVNETIFEVVSDSTTTFSCAVYYLEILTKDIDGLVLSDVEIVAHSERVSVNIYNEVDGKAVLRLPVGEYQIKHYWLGVLVNESAYSLNENEVLEVICKVRTITFILNDNLGYTISDAQVEISSNGTNNMILYSLTSEKDGTVKARLPETNIILKVSWKNIDVAQESIYANMSEYTIRCSVIYARFVPTDDKGIVISGAQVIVYSGVGVLGSENSNETCSEIRLPCGEWNVVVHWLGIEVANKTLYIGNSTEYVINCSVIYAKIRPLDRGNNVLTKSYVSVYSVQGTLAVGECSSENVEFRIPAGAWHVSIIWKGVEVVNETISFTESKEYEIPCSVVYARVKPVDSRKVVLQSVQITVYSNDSLLAAEECGADGIIIKLPIGEWRIIVTYLGEKVADAREVVNGEEITVECSVSYITVKTKDSNGVALDGVSISVYSRDGRWLGYADTKNGKAELRIRNGEFVIKGKLSTEYMLSHIEKSVKKESNLSSDSEIVLKFDYPPAIYTTNLFTISLLGILVACATSIAIYGFIRKGKEEEENTSYIVCELAPQKKEDNAENKGDKEDKKEE